MLLLLLTKADAKTTLSSPAILHKMDSVYGDARASEILTSVAESTAFTSQNIKLTGVTLSESELGKGANAVVFRGIQKKTKKKQKQKQKQSNNNNNDNLQNATNILKAIQLFVKLRKLLTN